jgi:hypothetical protein
MTAIQVPVNGASKGENNWSAERCNEVVSQDFGVG